MTEGKEKRRARVTRAFAIVTIIRMTRNQDPSLLLTRMPEKRKQNIIRVMDEESDNPLLAFNGSNGLQSDPTIPNGLDGSVADPTIADPTAIASKREGLR